MTQQKDVYTRSPQLAYEYKCTVLESTGSLAVHMTLFKLFEHVILTPQYDHNSNK